LGADEIHRGKAQKFSTVLSYLVHREVIGLAPERTQESLTSLLKTSLDAQQRAAVEAVCTDMHRPYVNAVHEVLPKAEVIYDKFHVLQHAGRRSTKCGATSSFAPGRRCARSAGANAGCYCVGGKPSTARSATS
jgi:transposase